MPLKRLNVFIMVAGLLSAPAITRPAESAPIDLAGSIRKITVPNADQRLLARYQNPQHAAPCDPVRHTLIGDPIGFVAGTVIVRRIVREADGHGGAKNTFLGG